MRSSTWRQTKSGSRWYSIAIWKGQWYREPNSNSHDTTRRDATQEINPYVDEWEDWDWKKEIRLKLCTHLLGHKLVIILSQESRNRFWKSVYSGLRLEVPVVIARRSVASVYEGSGGCRALLPMDQWWGRRLQTRAVLDTIRCRWCDWEL